MPMSTGRVLVVEDNLDNMTFIVDVLTSLDYEVIQAKDGISGVEQAESEQPDLILMDLSLPKMDGWQATRTIKARDILRDIPIIAITAHAMLGDRELALEAGCDDYITKPINLQELAGKLDQYIG
ncbi:MAG: response regulator [Chloroflexota bacterium]